MTNTKNIPEKLKKNGFFCVWKYQEVQGRQTKVPYNPLTGRNAKSNDPDTFSTLEKAVAVQSNYDGIGVGIFNGVSAIDIDHCIDNDVISEMASDIITIMDSYTETSPSGKGIRILFQTNDFHYDSEMYYINNQKLGLEVYVAGSTNKYVTITGNFRNIGNLENRSDSLQIVLDKYMKRKQNINNSPAKLHASDDYLAIGLEKDAVLKDIWNGKRIGASESESDLAFMNKLAFWCNGDIDLMIKSFKSSPYASGKDIAHVKKMERDDYMLETARKAVSGCNSTAQESNTEYLKKRTQVVKDYKISVEGEEKTLFDLQPNKNERYGWNDKGSGYLFADIYKNQARYVTERKCWYVYSDKVWEQDTGSLKVMELSKELATNLIKYALTIVEDRDRQQYIEFCNKFNGRKPRETIINEAKSVFPISYSAFDKDISLFNCKNGTLDLNTRELKSHNPLDLLSKISNVIYKPNVKSERWLSFINEIMQGDIECARFFQKALGYALSGDTSVIGLDEEKLLLEEIKLLSVRERRMLKRIDDHIKKNPKGMCIEQIMTVSNSQADSRALGRDTKTTKIEPVMNQIHKIEEALTRVQARKQVCIDLLYKMKNDKRNFDWDNF